jgi:hypothetical protein
MASFPSYIPLRNCRRTVPSGAVFLGLAWSGNLPSSWSGSATIRQRHEPCGASPAMSGASHLRCEAVLAASPNRTRPRERRGRGCCSHHSPVFHSPRVLGSGRARMQRNARDWQWNRDARAVHRPAVLDRDGKPTLRQNQVERVIRYVRGALLPAPSITGLDDLNAHAKVWRGHPPPSAVPPSPTAPFEISSPRSSPTQHGRRPGRENLEYSPDWASGPNPAALTRRARGLTKSLRFSPGLAVEKWPRWGSPV